MLHALLLATALAAPATQPAPETAPATRPAVETYGEPMTLDPAVPVGEVLADPKAFDGRKVKLRGVVAGVCESRGCWLTLGAGAEADETVFVKFTCEGDRIIPMDAYGEVGVVEGVVTVEEMSEEDARHFAEDGGASPEEVAAIQGPQPSITLTGPSAAILR